MTACCLMSLVVTVESAYHSRRHDWTRRRHKTASRVASLYVDIRATYMQRSPLAWSGRFHADIHSDLIEWVIWKSMSVGGTQRQVNVLVFMVYSLYIQRRNSERKLQSNKRRFGIIGFAETMSESSRYVVRIFMSMFLTFCRAFNAFPVICLGPD